MVSSSNYVVTKVTDALQIRDFNEFPASLYKDDKNWCRPLDSSVEELFDKHKNKQLIDGDIVRWLVKDLKGQYNLQAELVSLMPLMTGRWLRCCLIRPGSGL
jgi:hypothetical protein